MSSYRCYWKRTESGYEMHMAEHPKIRGKGATFELAMEELWEAIFKFKNDWEPHLALWPPKPVAKKDRHFTGDWLMVGSGGDPATVSEPMDALYSKGLCPICRAGLGTRTAAPLAFPFAELEGNDIGYVRETRRGIRATLRVVSAEFINAFLDGNESASQLRSCHNTGKPSKKLYYEVRATKPVEPVPLKHPLAEITNCKACHQKEVRAHSPVKGIYKFALKADLEAIKGSWAFLTTDTDFYHVIIRASRVNPCEQGSGLKGASIGWLGIANEEDVVRKLPVRIVTEDDSNFKL